MCSFQNWCTFWWYKWPLLPGSFLGLQQTFAIALSYSHIENPAPSRLGHRTSSRVRLAILATFVPIYQTLLTYPLSSVLVVYPQTLISLLTGPYPPVFNLLFASWASLVLGFHILSAYLVRYFPQWRSSTANPSAPSAAPDATGNQPAPFPRSRAAGHAVDLARMASRLGR